MMASKELTRKYGWNIGYVGTYLEFLTLAGHIKDEKSNFVYGIFLSESGIRVLRAAWLRHLGFFPKKAKKN